MDADTDPDDDIDDGPEWIDELDTAESMNGPSRRVPNFFEAASTLLGMLPSSPALPLHVFSTPLIAFHLNHRPDISRITVDALAVRFNIPDLRAALADFLANYLANQDTHHIGGRRFSQHAAPLPFQEVQAWFSVRVQTHSCDGTDVTPPQKLMASPPSEAWPQGRCDTAMFCQDANSCLDFPPAGLQGVPVKVHYE